MPKMVANHQKLEDSLGIYSQSPPSEETNLATTVTLDF